MVERVNPFLDGACRAVHRAPGAAGVADCGPARSDDCLGHNVVREEHNA
jgi:hypothetical protein